MQETDEITIPDGNSIAASPIKARPVAVELYGKSTIQTNLQYVFMLLFLCQEFIHKKQYCYAMFDILYFVVKKVKGSIWIIVLVYNFVESIKLCGIFCLDFYQGPRAEKCNFSMCRSKRLVRS